MNIEAQSVYEQNVIKSDVIFWSISSKMNFLFITQRVCAYVV